MWYLYKQFCFSSAPFRTFSGGVGFGFVIFFMRGLDFYRSKRMRRVYSHNDQKIENDPIFWRVTKKTSFSKSLSKCSLPWISFHLTFPAMSLANAFKNPTHSQCYDEKRNFVPTHAKRMNFECVLFVGVNREIIWLELFWSANFH